MASPATGLNINGATYVIDDDGWHDPDGRAIYLADVFAACGDDNNLRDEARTIHMNTLVAHMDPVDRTAKRLLNDIVELTDVVYGPEVADIAGWPHGARKVANRLYEGGLPQPAFRGGRRNRAWARKQILRHLDIDI